MKPGSFWELKGENPFKARAYYNAARTVEDLGEDLEKLVEEERLHEVPGFREAIVKKDPRVGADREDRVL